MSPQQQYLYIADSQNRVIRALNLLTGNIQTIADGETQEEGPALSVTFGLPYDVTTTPQGHIYVVDTLANRIKKIS